VERYPRLLKPIARGAGEARVELSYADEETYTTHRINLAGELGLSGGETVNLF
jgi:hypothetical protein